MKIKYKLLPLFAGAYIFGIVSCNKFLDRAPLSSVTPQAYFTNVEQVGSYTLYYYPDCLKDSRNKSLYHDYNWRSGKTLNDDFTDNLITNAVNTNLFAGEWLVPAGQNLLSDYSKLIRTWNWFFEQILPKMNDIQGDRNALNQYLGEAYFFRAMTYYRALCNFGDFPIIKETLPEDRNILIEKSVREPRNKVARFILSDLDEAIKLLQPKGYSNNQRLNKMAAYLFKSRVALYEATFEKYHKGTGRVPGDPTWPGKDVHKDEQFDIDKEIEFFLDQAMEASKMVADNVPLENNTGVAEPTSGTSKFNPYFEMFSSVNLSSFGEVLLWKQYNSTYGINHDAAYILTAGGDHLGLTRSLINSYVMKNGLPIYAQDSGYPGDEDIAEEGKGRDGRMDLFVFHVGNTLRIDPADPMVVKKGGPVKLDSMNIITFDNETRDLTGYRPRKYTSFDYNQMVGNQVVCTTGSIVFRGVEAYLNYMEACYLRKNSLDADAQKYWRAIRTRAGVDPDYQKTIDATDLDKEFNLLSDGKTVVGDLAVYSGDQKVDKTLYNIRRERRCELISEGHRWDDLIRWRSWDNLIAKYKFQPEGVNFWSKLYKIYDNSKNNLTSDPDNDKSNINAKTISMYVRPLAKTRVNNSLFEGYSFKKAYYLSPVGVENFTITQQEGKTKIYQNPYWPMQTGKALE